MGRFASFAAVVLVAFAPLASAQSRDPDLERGIQLVKQGEYGQAVILLDQVAGRLSASPAQKGLAAQAYVNLGIAYVGDGQETLARAAFRDALTRDAALQLSAFDVSPKVRELFQKAKDEVAQRTTAVAPPKKGGGGGKAVLIVLGVAAVGGGVAVAAGGGKSSGSSPSGGNVTVLIERRDIDTAVVGLKITFGAQPSGPCGGQSFSWNFGDGGTGSGQIVAHAFDSAGTFTVTATTPCDGRSTSGTLSVTVRSLAGTWAGTSVDRYTVHIAQSGANLSGDVDGTAFTGTVMDPRSVRLTAACGGTLLSAGIDSAANILSGTGSWPCRRDQVFSTMIRQ